MNLRVQIGMRIAASSVKIHHLLQILQAPVVHIRCCQADIAQRWRLELAPVSFVMCHCVPVGISDRTRVDSNSDIVEFVVGEQGIFLPN